jgi:enamine deaminase RidA (YjgF/YER057c/UK114 family)
MSHPPHRQNIPGTSPYESVIGFSRAVRIGNHIHVSGTGPVGADEANVADQADQCLTLIAAALKQAGSSIEHVYRTRIYLTRASDWEAVGRIHCKFFSITRPPPPWSSSPPCSNLPGGSRSKPTPSSPNNLAPPFHPWNQDP